MIGDSFPLIRSRPPRMPILDVLADAIATPLRNLVTPTYWLNVYFMLSTFAIVVAVFAAHRRGRRRTLKQLLRFAFPRRVLLHPSALLDYRYYLVHGTLRTLFYGWVIVSGDVWSRLTIAGLTGAFGATTPGITPSIVVTLIATVLFVVAYDLGYWFAHWLMHRVEWLWECHKAHHSAEVLTPFTSMRAHPVDDLLHFNLGTIATGISHGMLVYGFGQETHELSLMQMNVLLLVYTMLLFHLRHSHVWLSFSVPLGYVVQSPAHHQIHHSTDPAHIGKNLGFALAIWDWAFGTLYVPREREKLQFGIGPETREYNSVERLYWLPVVNIARTIVARTSRLVTARQS